MLRSLLLTLAVVLLFRTDVEAFASGLNVTDTYTMVQLPTGINMHVRQLTVPDRDTNAAVVLLHGYPEGMAVWNPVVSRLLFDSYGTVLVPDLRGYNLTSKPNEVSDYDINLMVDDVVALIQTVLPKKAQVLLVGHDVGGGITYLAAAKYPKLLRGIFVMSAPQNDQLRHLLATNATQVKMVAPIWGPLIKAPRVVANTMRAANYAPILATLPPQFTPELKDQLHASYNISFTTMCLFYAAFPKSTMPSPEFITTPSWVAIGVHDPYLIVQNTDVSQWVNVQEVLLYDCEHYPQVEIPAQVQGDIETIAEIVLGE